MRYKDSPELKDSSTGKRYIRGVKYPSIPYSDEDFYIITVFGDRLDNLAFEYYGSVDNYWILMAANDIPRDSICLPEGTQLRIPADANQARILFNNLNGL
jgi:phage tail protein X